MIDWLTVEVEVSHQPVDGGRVISMTPDGEIDWEVPKRLPLEGSYSSKIQVRTVKEIFGAGHVLSISGNPAKWFQGHNLFGSDDLHCLVLALCFSVMEMIPGRFDPTPAELRRLEEGLYSLKRVDCTSSFALASRDEVRAWIRAASTVARGRHQKVSAYSDQTIYLGQKSRRLSLKVYCKGDEVKQHGFPVEMGGDQTDKLLSYADKLLRVELTLRSMELKRRQLEMGRNWAYDTSKSLLVERLKTMELPENVPLKADVEAEQLPPKLRAAYTLWLDGHDLRAMYQKRTFYRYRSELLKHGIDISVQPKKREESNIVPLWRYLVAEPAPVPDWAIGTPLYFDPGSYLKAKGF